MSKQYTYIKSYEGDAQDPATWTVGKVTDTGAWQYPVEDFTDESLAKELVDDLNSGARVHVNFEETEDGNRRPVWEDDSGQYRITRVTRNEGWFSHYALYWISGYPIKTFEEFRDACEFASEHATSRKLYPNIAKAIRP